MAVDQILVDNETEEGFRRDWRENFPKDLTDNDQFAERSLDLCEMQPPPPAVIDGELFTLPVLSPMPPVGSVVPNNQTQQVHLIEQGIDQILSSSQVPEHMGSQFDQEQQYHIQHQKYVQPMPGGLCLDSHEIISNKHQQIQVDNNSSEINNFPDSNSLLTSYLPLDGVSDTLLSYTSLEPSLSLSHNQGQLEDLNVLSGLTPANTISSTATATATSNGGSNMVGWHQISQPNSQL